MNVELALPRLIRLGGGAVQSLGQVITELGLRRPLVVTDRFLASTGSADSMRAALRVDDIDAAVFSDTVADPTTDSLLGGLRAIAEHRADAVIGFGGGSPMDTAKALALLAANGGEMRDYKAPFDNVAAGLPIIAVPTTAGSGSEATRFTVITDSRDQEKMLCAGRAFLPIAAIIDYELTLTMPQRLTADTGVDALTHAIEAFVSRKANPFSDGLALTAIRTIGQYLRRAYRDGTDRAAREAMMLAATQAGIAFSNSSVALVHGMSRPIGVHFQVAHGLSNAMLFPAVTAFSVAGAEHRYAMCANAFGVADESDADDYAARSLVDALAELCRDVEVPTPKAYGITPQAWSARIPQMAQQAVASGSPANNPVVPTVSQIEQIYAEIFD